MHSLKLGAQFEVNKLCIIQSVVEGVEEEKIH
jgi:hypothetical protein